MHANIFHLQCKKFCIYRIKQADKFLDLQQLYTPDPEVLYGVMENQDHNSVACASRMESEWRIGFRRTFAEPQT